MAKVRDLVVRISVTERTDRGIRRVTTSLRETNRELDNANKNSGRFGGTLSKLGRTSLGGLSRGLSDVTRFTATAGKGLLLVASAVSALNTVVQAGVGLAPLAGGLALIPAVALGAATALGTLQLAMVGVGDAFSAALGSDSKKFKESLQSLAPAARSVAKEVHALRPELLGIQRSAQQALFKPLTGQLVAMAKVLAGPVRQGATYVAGAFGQAGRSVAEFARQSKSVELVKAAFGQTGFSIRQLIPAIQPVLAGLRALAVEGLAFLPQIAGSVSTVVQRFGLWLQQAVATGRATAWIQNFLATLKQIGGLLQSVGGILKSVFSAASAAGSNFLGVIGAALSQLNAFLKTAAGQQALQSIFAALGAIGTALGPVIGALVGGLGQLAAPLAQLAQLIGPILTTAITALAPALAAIGPGLQALFGGLGQAVELVAPALLPLGRAIAQIGVAIGPVLPIVGRLVGQLVSGLAPILGQLLIALSPLLVALVKLVGVFTPLIPPIAQIIVQLVQGLVPALTPIIGIIGRIAGIIGQFLISAFQKLMPVINQLLPILSQIATNVGTALITVLQALAPALIDILVAVLPLVPSLVQLLIPVSRLLVVLTPIIALLVKLAAVILRNVLPIVVYLINVVLKLVVAIENGLVTAIGWLVRNLPKIGSTVIHAFAGAGKWLYNIGKDIIVGLWNGLASLGNWLYHRLVSLVKAIIPAPIRWALGIHSPSKVMADLGRLAGMGLAVGIDASRTGVSAAATRLAGAAVPAVPAFAAPAGVAATASARPVGGGAAGVDVKTLAAAISQALHGTTVNLDSKPVGQIMSRTIGQTTDLRRRTG